MQQEKEMKEETWRGWSTWERRSEEWWGKRVRSAESAVSVCFGGILLINPIAASISLSLSLIILCVCVCVSLWLYFYVWMNVCIVFLPSFLCQNSNEGSLCLFDPSFPRGNPLSSYPHLHCLFPNYHPHPFYFIISYFLFNTVL